MGEYTTITVSTTTKEELDKQRKTPIGEVSVNDFLKYLLEKNKKKK